MARIPQDVIDQVLAAHDVVEVVGRHVALKPAGRSWKGLCPFHDEKTPSFTVNPERQSFKCFGCGKGGNVFGFLMEHEGLSFPEAVRSLARERGIEVPDGRTQAPGEAGLVEKARRALQLAQRVYRKAFQADMGREARGYLEHRGYDADACRRFGLGYAPAGWDTLLGIAGRKGLGAKVLEDAGLALARRDGSGHYDRFRHRITFPVRDLQGRIVSFGARALAPEDEPKYLNGPETVVFKKANLLFALDRAKDAIRRTGHALLMEGYTDVLMAHLHGFEEAVAGMGTAFTPAQARLVKRFADRIVLVYDADDAGRQAAERTLDLGLEAGLDVRVALLPEGRDVDEILLEEGPEAFGAIVEGALGFLPFKMRAVGARHDLGSPRGRARAAEEAVASIVRIPGPIERDQHLRALAEGLGDVEMEGALRAEAARVLQAEARRRRPRRVREAAPGGEGPPGATEGERPAPTRRAGPAERLLARTRRDGEEALLAGVLLFADLREAIFRAVGVEHFTDPVLRRVYKGALDLSEAGRPCDLRSVAARLADDGEAQAALAGLPEDPTLEERIPLQIEHLERLRRKERRTLEIRRLLDEPAPDDTLSTPDPSPSDLPSPERQR